VNLTGKCNFYTAYFKILTYELVLICIFSFSTYISCPDAQILLTTKQSKTDPRSRMSLSADKLILNRDANTITAEGNVQIEYDGNKVVARHVSYNQKTKRVIAEGNIEIVDAKGEKLYAEQIDLSDDLKEGFINRLQAETLDKAYFSAESAERSQGQITIFNNSVYTACELCHSRPEKDILWRIKAKRIIWNSRTKTIRFEGNKFEIFNMPIIRLPTFEIADSTVKRESGFLIPSFSYKSYLGLGIKNSYFWNLASNYDFTLSANVYSKQGLLTQGEWRNLLEKGKYDIRFSHIYQTNRNDFDYWTPDHREKNRYMFSTKGQFVINPHWIYGWDIMAESDHNFGRTYEIDDYNKAVEHSQIYLKGLHERNHFNMQFYHFNVQEDIFKDYPERNVYESHSRQPWVLPRIDYTFIPDDAIFGGELKFTANLQIIYREKADFSFSNEANNPLSIDHLTGIKGTNARLTNKLDWKRSFINDYGLVLTPIFSLRGDAITIHTNKNYPQINLRSDTLREMATAGLEIHYPLLLTINNSSHIIQPIAQIFVRNNEQYTGKLINEDARSFVFDATTLFLSDKFSGYDRLEGGTRANVGMRYSGDFDNGWSIYSLAGQSYQLLGRNSYSSNDIMHVSANSGLENARSDYVAMLSIDDGNGFTLASHGRFDKKNLMMRRGEIDLQKHLNFLTFGLQYAYIERQPNYEHAQNHQEITVHSGYRLNDKWQLSANTSYDTVSETLIGAGTGFSYQNECFGLIFNYLQTRNPRKSAVSHKWNFLISFRTLGDFGSSTLP